MKVFLSYKFTGENPEKLNTIIPKICGAIEKSGNNFFCSFFLSDFYSKNKFTNKQILEYALNELDRSDLFVAFINSENKSEGMILEAGYALAKKKKIYIAIRKGVKTTFFREMADKIIEFESIEELCRKLEKLR